MNRSRLLCIIGVACMIFGFVYIVLSLVLKYGESTETSILAWTITITAMLTFITEMQVRILEKLEELILERIEEDEENGNGENKEIS